MLHIRPVSDLRNKFPEIETTVLKNGEPVYLTKTGMAPWCCSAWNNTLP